MPAPTRRRRSSLPFIPIPFLGEGKKSRPDGRLERHLNYPNCPSPTLAGRPRRKTRCGKLNQVIISRNTPILPQTAPATRRSDLRASPVKIRLLSTSRSRRHLLAGFLSPRWGGVLPADQAPAGGSLQPSVTSTPENFQNCFTHLKTVAAEIIILGIAKSTLARRRARSAAFHKRPVVS
jgi:hypothetical protein